MKNILRIGFATICIFALGNTALAQNKSDSDNQPKFEKREVSAVETVTTSSRVYQPSSSAVQIRTRSFEQKNSIASNSKFVGKAIAKNKKGQIVTERVK